MASSEHLHEPVSSRAVAITDHDSTGTGHPAAVAVAELALVGWLGAPEETLRAVLTGDPFATIRAAAVDVAVRAVFAIYVIAFFGVGAGHGAGGAFARQVAF